VNKADQLSRFHLIPERYGQTDRQTDGQICYISMLTRDKNKFVVACSSFRYVIGFQKYVIRYFYYEKLGLSVLS